MQKMAEGERGKDTGKYGKILYRRIGYRRDLLPQIGTLDGVKGGAVRPDVLRVDGVPPETRAALQEAAMKLYGQPNASLLVRQLIASHLVKPAAPVLPLTADQAADTVRVEIRLPRVALDKIEALAEGRFSSRNYYLTSLIMAHLGKPQLQGDEIEVLRKSNFEIAKIGTNLNQISKAFNTIVKFGEGKLPELGKKIASLRRDVTDHTGRVLRVLDAGTTVWEPKGSGQKKARKRPLKG
jgi:hypothetical protein